MANVEVDHAGEPNSVTRANNAGWREGLVARVHGERLDGAEGAQKSVVDLARVVGAHGGGRFLLWRTRGRGWITLAATLRLTQGKISLTP